MSAFIIDTNLPEIEYFERAVKDGLSEKTRDELLLFFEKMKPRKKSKKTKIATATATATRTARAKEKIQNAINILRLENKKITYYTVAKTANVSYLTVKKYTDLEG